MFKKILVPADGSETALQAAGYALKMAEKFDSEVTLLHVVQDFYSLPAFNLTDTITIPLSVMTDLEANGKLILEKTAEIFSSFGGKLSQRIEYGSPGRRVVEIASEEKFSVIVMGRRGLSGISGLLLGSVSNHLVHSAPCPLLIVKGPADLE